MNRSTRNIVSVANSGQFLGLYGRILARPPGYSLIAPEQGVSLYAFLHKQLGASWEYLEKQTLRRLFVMLHVARKSAESAREAYEEQVALLRGKSHPRVVPM